MANAGYLPGDERRRTILDAAKAVFAERGYHDTHVSHICARLGIARGTLYQHFQSKRDVFLGVLEDLCERLRELVRTRPPLALDPVHPPSQDEMVLFAKVRLLGILQAIFVDEASLRILLREAVGIDVGLDEVLRRIDDIVVDACAGDLEVARAAGFLREDVDVRLVAMLIVGGVEKLALAELTRASRDAGAFDLDELAERVVRVQLFGIVKP